MYLLAFLNLSLFFFIVDSSTLVFLPSFKVFSSFSNFKLPFALSLLNLAGVPPAPMFFVKLSAFNAIFSSYNIYLGFLVFFLNLAAMIFYLQTLRYLTPVKNLANLNMTSRLVFFNKGLAVALTTVSLVNLSLPILIFDILALCEQLVVV